MSTYIPKKYEIAGFELYGERQDDGSIKLGASSETTHLPAFPEQVEVCGVVYTLECVTENEWDGRDSCSPDDPRLRICWGVYV